MPSTSWPNTTHTGNGGCQSNRSTAWSMVPTAAISYPRARIPSTSGSASQACSHGTVSWAPSAVLEIAVLGGRAVMPDTYSFSTLAASAVRKNAPHVVHAAHVVQQHRHGQRPDAGGPSS